MLDPRDRGSRSGLKSCHQFGSVVEKVLLTWGFVAAVTTERSSVTGFLEKLVTENWASDLGFSYISLFLSPVSPVSYLPTYRERYKYLSVRGIIYIHLYT